MAGAFARIAAVVVSAVILGTAAAGQARIASPPLNGVNFISVSGFAHFAPDDPIVYPGRPGISHLHAFAGNTSTNADSTAATLRGAGTTCRRKGDTAAYWMPALLVDGQPQTPLHADVYYRRTTNAKVRPFPPGLKMLAGNAYAVKPQSILVTYWDCGDQSDVPRSSTVPDCGAGSTVRLRVNFPDCWDGTRLDSPDHRSHMAYSNGGRCPRSHPVAVPGISLIYAYAMPSAANLSTEVVLASGGQLSGHGDFVNSWNQAALKKLVDSCLNRYRHCGTGS